LAPGGKPGQRCPAGIRPDRHPGQQRWDLWSHPNFSSYAASKAGLARLADTLAEELKPFNVQINRLDPFTTKPLIAKLK